MRRHTWMSGLSISRFALDNYLTRPSPPHKKPKRDPWDQEQRWWPYLIAAMIVSSLTLAFWLWLRKRSLRVTMQRLRKPERCWKSKEWTHSTTPADCAAGEKGL